MKTLLNIPDRNEVLDRLTGVRPESQRRVGASRVRPSNDLPSIGCNENPTWGAPRIHGELLRVGFEVSERSVSRWVRRAPKDPDPVKRWLTFFRNHREAIAAMDFFTVPTLTFGILYCFFVIGHDRRRILHFNVTGNPMPSGSHCSCGKLGIQTAAAILIFDRDSKFGAEVVSTVKDMGSEPTRTAFRSPWQNGVAERWVGSCRRDLLDHVIILNERHLKRLMSSYLLYYHEDRTHLGLAKDTPASRPTEIRSARENKIQSFRDSGAAPSLCGGSVDSEPLSDDQTLLLVTRPRTVHVFCEHLSPVDESACNPKPKSLRQTGRTPFNLGHNDLANDYLNRKRPHRIQAVGLCILRR